jgi:hypothetical protein
MEVQRERKMETRRKRRQREKRWSKNIDHVEEREGKIERNKEIEEGIKKRRRENEKDEKEI